MKTEYEVRILEVDVPEIVKKIEEMGAKRIEEHEFQRYTYDFNPPRDMEWIRLRTNGKKTTVTIKRVDSHTADGTKELETEVGDFNAMNEILERLGYDHKSYQENTRVSYMLDGVMLEIDSWPLIPTYLEIEGESEEAVYKMVEILGYEREKICTLDVSTIYKTIYNIDLDNIKELRA
ncbi:MAG TPA: adenylate cyclase [Clostridiales bacterium]|nr:MAG: hypothetical protein A2Y18_08510 [Clostridiales bacterium GWD2_32_19]HCC07414.1 adenylate cyclase [Clostridiales bacterium]